MLIQFALNGKSSVFHLLKFFFCSSLNFVRALKAVIHQMRFYLLSWFVWFNFDCPHLFMESIESHFELIYRINTVDSTVNVIRCKKSEIYKQHLFSQLKNSQSHLISSDSWDVIKTIHFCWSFAIISSFTDNSRHSDHRLILFQFVLAWNWLILTWQATAVAWKTIKFEKGIERRSNENHCTKLLYNFAKKKCVSFFGCPVFSMHYFQRKCNGLEYKRIYWRQTFFVVQHWPAMCIYLFHMRGKKRTESCVFFSLSSTKSRCTWA